MPIRPLNSPVLRWPDAQAVHKAVRSWAERLAQERPEVRAVGYFGSYARGDWGVGSDLDIVIIVARSEKPFAARASAFDATGLPVPADLLVYTQAEWRSLDLNARFTRVLRQETVWVYGLALMGTSTPLDEAHDPMLDGRNQEGGGLIELHFNW